MVSGTVGKGAHFLGGFRGDSCASKRLWGNLCQKERGSGELPRGNDTETKWWTLTHLMRRCDAANAFNAVKHREVFRAVGVQCLKQMTESVGMPVNLVQSERQQTVCHHSFLIIARGSSTRTRCATGWATSCTSTNRSSLLAGTDPANRYDTECAQTIFVGHVARRIFATTNDKLIQPTEEIDTDLVQCHWKEEHIRT